MAGYEKPCCLRIKERGKVSEKIIFATGNAGKLKEIREILKDLNREIVTMREAGFEGEIEENGTTFRENAEIKAKAVWEKTGGIVLADDSGLVIDYLNGEPGVYPARYAEPGKRKATVLEKLKGVPEEKRGAHFTSAICCVFPNGDVLEAEGYCYGRIAEECRGESGFGYDPIFICTEEGCAGKTFGEATAEEKDAVSHRGKSLRIFAEKLENYLKDKEG